MLKKCANESCSTPLRYLRGGRVFRRGPDRAADFWVESSTELPQVEFFWLCEVCCQSLTLSYDRRHGARVVAKRRRAEQAPDLAASLVV